ncbi:dihydroneopterin aldolase [Zavarzinia compransoris]|uniref:dihydroneopterin aldolase n=1 Tax=Zavarzinia marina TaxID=2911065 RepID=UPI001F33E979|nr:dihydroneopterin aldolase [Zavarzinia marina]MCF4164291.1 dihydroneopterin aldolase [Zavarzinia marina]
MTKSFITPVGFADAHQGLAHLFVRGLTVEAEIGVWSHEKGRRQIIRLDMDLAVDDTRSAGDDHGKVVCYEWASNEARDVIASGHFNLVERLAEEIAARLLCDPRVHAVRIRVEKPGAIRGADGAGIEIVRLATRSPEVLP